MYHLVPNNQASKTFRMSAFHWPLILEQCGTYFAAIFHQTRWFYVSSLDERMGDSEEGPSIILNDGFPVTGTEAKVLARITKNYIAMQRELDPNKPNPLMPALKLNLLDQLEAFAEWAETSEGFQVR